MNLIKIILTIITLTTFATANIHLFGSLVYSNKYKLKIDHTPIKVKLAKAFGNYSYYTKKHKRYTKYKKHKRYRKHTKYTKYFKHKRYRYHFPKGGIRVKISAYTSHRNQCDKTPFITAISYKLNRYDKKRVVAVSHDLFKRLKGKVVLLRYYQYHKLHTIRVRVVDLMNPRYRRTVDLYYYLDKKGARRFGRRHGRLIALPKYAYSKIPSYKIYKWKHKRYKRYSRLHKKRKRIKT